MKLNQFVLFHVWDYKDNCRLFSLAEVVVTILLSSFMTEGGCNSKTPGGSVSRNIENVRNSLSWDKSKEKVL